MLKSNFFLCTTLGTSPNGTANAFTSLISQIFFSTKFPICSCSLFWLQLRTCDSACHLSRVGNASNKTSLSKLSSLPAFASTKSAPSPIPTSTTLDSLILLKKLE
ncbi:hypothetical protein BpHYR1_006828 [Brachionus plicatilis]|uniref:Uncharacterized protein n=1 Tax=Brachionus plicatilis TaxID=10195 RepID=A0A3M7RSP7_BRAPC|nr:hypothetical protein BpHYR1_006828 [Brachionus plicatilis]